MIEAEAWIPFPGPAPLREQRRASDHRYGGKFRIFQKICAGGKKVDEQAQRESQSARGSRIQM
jgi:hypothetical protein